MPLAARKIEQPIQGDSEKPNKRPERMAPDPVQSEIEGKEEYYRTMIASARTDKQFFSALDTLEESDIRIPSSSRDPRLPRDEKSGLTPKTVAMVFSGMLTEAKQGKERVMVERGLPSALGINEKAQQLLDEVFFGRKIEAAQSEGEFLAVIAEIKQIEGGNIRMSNGALYLESKKAGEDGALEKQIKAYWSTGDANTLKGITSRYGIRKQAEHFRNLQVQKKADEALKDVRKDIQGDVVAERIRQVINFNIDILKNGIKEGLENYKGRFMDRSGIQRTMDWFIFTVNPYSGRMGFSGTNKVGNPECLCFTASPQGEIAEISEALLNENSQRDERGMTTKSEAREVIKESLKGMTLLPEAKKFLSNL